MSKTIKKSSSRPKNGKLDLIRLNTVLSQAVLDGDLLGDLLAGLGCKVRLCKDGRYYRGACPVHEGDGDGFVVYMDGRSLPISWTCNTKNCHWEWVPNLLGLVRGVLSAGRLKPAHPAVAADYLRRFLAGHPVPSHRPRAARPPQTKTLSLTREQARSLLDVPAPYFVGRGFSPAVLDRLDVGHSRMSNRSVVPIHADSGETVVGFLTRSELPTCDACDRCHRPGQACRYGQVRWKVMDDFPKGDHLYNYHTALRSTSRVVLLVEGPGDVWRAEEAGHLAVAVLGNAPTRQQVEKLATLNKHVLVALDNDQAGKKGRLVAEERLRGAVSFSHMFVSAAYKDIGSMPVADAVRWLSSCVTDR